MTQQYKRWYDINPVITDAIHAWQYFPLPLQRSLARYMDGMIKKGDLPMRYKGVSRFLVLLLIKKDNTYTKRWYDQDKLVQNTINTLSYVEFPALVEACHCIVKLRKYVREKPIDANKLPEPQLMDVIAFVFENPELI